MTISPIRPNVQSISKEWIDYNGHMSMRFYPVLFEQFADQFLESIGLGETYSTASNNSMRASETHLRFIRELHSSDRVYSSFLYLGHSDHELVYAQELYHVDGWISATIEVSSLHVDTNSRAIVPFPKEIAEILLRVASDQADRSVPTYIGRSVGMKRRDLRSGSSC